MEVEGDGGVRGGEVGGSESFSLVTSSWSSSSSSSSLACTFDVLRASVANR